MDEIDVQDRREWMLLFAVCVANKTERHARRVIDGLMSPVWASPFDCIRILVADGKLADRLRELHSGQYSRLEKCLTVIVESELDFAVCTCEELESIHGIGPKTSRYFILETRPGARVAALDTHILKWLRSLGHNAPISTPTGKRYAELERIFIREADARRITPKELDEYVWTQYAVRQPDVKQLDMQEGE